MTTTKYSHKFITLFILTFISIGILRFLYLGKVPYGLNIDEASYGYDAFSIMKTGRDQWGLSHPLTLKSFGDYKPAGLSYLMIPAVKLFGLNTLATRTPSAIFGYLTLFVLFMTLEILRHSPYLNLFMTVIFSLSPWHFGISRLFYEPNIGLFFISIGILLLSIYTKNRTQHSKTGNSTSASMLYIAFIMLGLSGYMYAALRFIAIGIVIAFFIANLETNTKKQSSASIKRYLKPLLVFAITLSPLLLIMFSKVGLKRLNQESRLRNFGHELVINENREMCYLYFNKNLKLSKACYAIWNKPIETINTIYEVWIQYMNPKYLFMSGYQKDIVPYNYGAYISLLAVPYILGLAYITYSYKTDRLSKFIILSYISSTLVPSAAQAIVIHRNVVGLYIAFIITMYGIHWLIDNTDKVYRYAVYIMLSAGFFMTIRFIAFYFIVYTNQQPLVWNYRSQDIFSFVNKVYDRYDEIIFQGFEDAPLYYAFFSSMDPDTYRSSIKRNNMDEYGWIHSNSLGKISTKETNIMELVCSYSNNNANNSNKNTNKNTDKSTTNTNNSNSTNNDNKNSDNDNSKNILFITTPQSDISKYAIYKTKTFNGVHVLNEIYDIKLLYEKLKHDETYNLESRCKKLFTQTDHANRN